MRGYMKVSFVLFTCALATSWTACGPGARNDDDFGDDDGSNGSGSNPGSGVAAECNKMDIVFVVDDSGSMSEEQTNLHANFPMFATVLSQYRTMDGQALDFRIGITTTGKHEHYDPIGGIQLPDENGPNGGFEHQSGCGTGLWLDQTDGNLMSDLSCRANVGTTGSSQEMPMLMAKRAVSDRIMDGTNGAFLRDDALLAAVMITDEDDSSNTDDSLSVPLAGITPNWNPSDEVQFFDTLKGNRTRWAAAVIAGETDCMSNLGSAVEATRLQEFVTDANSNSTQAVFSSICDGDLSIGLSKALDTFQTACGNIIF
ncbi:MAG: hypothetical protein QM831_23095 [Kofleriaceae bacterium]